MKLEMKSVARRVASPSGTPNLEKSLAFMRPTNQSSIGVKDKTQGKRSAALGKIGPTNHPSPVRAAQEFVIRLLLA